MASGGAPRGAAVAAVRIVAALVAVALLLAYVGPMVLKMKDAALAAVIVVGVAVMLADLWQSLRRPDD